LPPVVVPVLFVPVLSPSPVEPLLPVDAVSPVEAVCAVLAEPPSAGLTV
jgi:hypothetical protein